MTLVDLSTWWSSKERARLAMLYESKPSEDAGRVIPQVRISAEGTVHGSFAADRHELSEQAGEHPNKGTGRMPES